MGKEAGVWKHNRGKNGEDREEARSPVLCAFRLCAFWERDRAEKMPGKPQLFVFFLNKAFK